MSQDVSSKCLFFICSARTGFRKSVAIVLYELVSGELVFIFIFTVYVTVATLKLDDLQTH